MRALIVGAGGTTARWRELVNPADYEIIAVLNGAVTCGIPCTHGFLMDERSPEYPWFEQTCRTVTHQIVANWVNCYPFAVTYTPEGVEVTGFGCESFISMVPDWVGVAPQESGRVLLTGTVMHTALHYLGHEPGVTQIDLLGCDAEFDEREDGTYMHFYDTEPIDPKFTKNYLLQFSQWKYVAAQMVDYFTIKKGLVINFLKDGRPVEMAA